MSAFDMQRWEKARAQGRERFLLLGIGRAYGFLVGGVVVELLWWLFTKKIPDPLLAVAARLDRDWRIYGLARMARERGSLRGAETT